MRVVDLDRDMSDVIPTGMTPDSEFLFERMTRVTLDRTEPAPGRKILDVASGVGQDAMALARRGAVAFGAEPSARMTGMAKLYAANNGFDMPHWIQGWSDSLPFDDDTFDASFCKGALDHFDCPDRAIAEMARVTKPDGRVVLAIANFESLACRAGRAIDDVLATTPLRDRRGYDAPSDHFTRYEVDLIREQAGAHVEISSVEGLSMGWGMPGWSQLMHRLPRRVADASIRMMHRVGQAWPTLADVIVVVGRPRRSSSTSA
jgi:SAM-dependent methyltransferase